MTLAPHIPQAPFATLPGVEMLHIQPPAQYASRPPGLHFFRPADPGAAREFLTVLSRPHVPARPEAVIRLEGALVIGGSHVVTREGTALRESYYNVKVTEPLLAAQRRQAARIAAGDVATLPEAGPPIVALFLQDSFNFGHLLAEALPRLLLLADAGIAEMRLLLPDACRPALPIIGFALSALGLRAEIIDCPADAIHRAPSLLWPSLVGEGWFKSPTVLRLFARLREAAPAPAGPARLFVTRPRGGRRSVANGPEAETLALARGFAVVEPSALPFPEQLALFAGARAVAGPMGAALTLLGAMPPEGRAGMIGPGYADYFYWDLACLAGLPFHWGFAAPLERFRMELLERPLALPPRLLARLLDAVAG
jgi:hypothetical protein